MSKQHLREREYHSFVSGCTNTFDRYLFKYAYISVPFIHFKYFCCLKTSIFIIKIIKIKVLMHKYDTSIWRICDTWLLFIDDNVYFPNVSRNYYFIIMFSSCIYHLFFFYIRTHVSNEFNRLTECKYDKNWYWIKS